MKAIWAAACAATVFATAAQAQGPCAGEYQVIRHSLIKPGQMDTFLKAAHDQQGWYASHGLTDRILVGRPLQADGGLAADSAMTIHTARSPNRPSTAGDAGWDAFVAEYRQSSEIKDETVVCVTPAG